jgi:hypothetical protein
VYHRIEAIGGEKFAKAVAITSIANNQRDAIRQELQCPRERLSRTVTW